MSCECESGKFGCSCCCASVTGLKAGIHPDSIKSVHADLVLDTTGTITQTHRTLQLLEEPSHIIGVNASLIAVRRSLTDTDAAQDKQLEEAVVTGDDHHIAGVTTASASIFVLPGYVQGDLDKGGFNPRDSQENKRQYIDTVSLSPFMPHYSAHEDLFGFFADGGLFVEFNCPTPEMGIRLIVRYVPRLHFSPAYHDPVAVMQHYWKCSRGDEEFLEGFYGGTTLDIPTENSSGTQSRSSHGISVGVGSWGTLTGASYSAL